MIKLEIKIETEKDTTRITPNIFNQNPSKMEQILCNFILDYCSKICNVSKEIDDNFNEIMKGKMKNEKGDY